MPASPASAWFHTADRPNALDGYSGDWLNESPDEVAAIISTPDPGHRPCDCTIDWITLRHPGDCPSHHQPPGLF